VKETEEILLQSLRDERATEMLSKLDNFAFEASSDFEIHFITSLRVKRICRGGKLYGITKRQLTLLSSILRRL
jgi:hypothetical protein